MKSTIAAAATAAIITVFLVVSPLDEATGAGESPDEISESASNDIVEEAADIAAAESAPKPAVEAGDEVGVIVVFFFVPCFLFAIVVLYNKQI